MTEQKNQSHPCVREGCNIVVAYDDEPYCFEHSPDKGSNVPGYSYAAEQVLKEVESTTVPTQVPAGGPPWEWTGPVNQASTTTSTWQPQPVASVEKSRTWLPWVLVTAIISVAAIIMVGIWALATTSNPIIDTIDPQTNLSEEEDGYDTAYSMFNMVWQDLSYNDQQVMCESWNAGMDDVLMTTFMEEAEGAGTGMGVTDAEIEAAVRDYLDGEC